MGISSADYNTYAADGQSPYYLPYSTPYAADGQSPYVDQPQVVGFATRYGIQYGPAMGPSVPYSMASKPSFLGGLGGLINPFRGIPLYMSPGEHAAPMVEAVAHKPFDAFATAMQSFVLPGLAMGAATKWLAPNTGSLMGDLKGVFTGAGRGGAFGKAAGVAAASRIASGVGLANTGRAARMLTGASGVVGSALGATMIPIAAAEGAMQLADSLLLDPYISTRQTAKDLRGNFENVSFAGAEGSVSRGGRGLSHSESTSIASDITRAGIRDLVLSKDDYTEIANLSSRAGLLDDAQVGDIARKVKDIAEQVKLVIRISKDPNVQNAIEELAKLQLGGASTDGGTQSTAAKIYSSLGMQASAAGISVQEMMKRAGNTGQGMFSAAGLTPYLGQLNAANLYAGFATGYRSGVVGEAQLARMGGLTGATQLGLSGMIGMAQTPLANILMYNRYLGNRRGEASAGEPVNVTEELSRFGQDVSRSPMNVMGAQRLYGKQLQSKYLSEGNVENIKAQAISILREMRVVPEGKGGTYSPEQLAVALSSQGMSDDQIVAFMSTLAVQADPVASATRIQGYKAQEYEQTAKQVESEGLGDSLLSRGLHSAKRAWKQAQESAFSGVVEPFNKAGAAFGDFTESVSNWWKGGSSLRKGGGVTLDEFRKDTRSILKDEGYTERTPRVYVDKDERELVAPFKGFKDISTTLDENSTAGDRLSAFFGKGRGRQYVLEYIQQAATDPNNPAHREAREFMIEQDKGKRAKALSNFFKRDTSAKGAEIKNRIFIQGFNPAEGQNEAEAIVEQASRLQTGEATVRHVPEKVRRYEREVSEVAGKNELSNYDDLRVIGKASAIAERFVSGEIDQTDLDDEIAKDPLLAQHMAGRKGTEAFKEIERIHNAARASGYLTLGKLASKIGTDEDVYKTNAHYLPTPELKKRFLQAKTPIEREKVKEEAAIMLHGGETKTLGISPSQRALPLSESVSVSRHAIERSTKVAQEVMNTSAKDVDIKKFQDTTKALDQFSNDFGANVKEFGRIVKQDMPRAVEGKNEPKSKFDKWYEDHTRLPGDKMIIDGLTGGIFDKQNNLGNPRTR